MGQEGSKNSNITVESSSANKAVLNNIMMNKNMKQNISSPSATKKKQQQYLQQHHPQQYNNENMNNNIKNDVDMINNNKINISSSPFLSESRSTTLSQKSSSLSTTTNTLSSSTISSSASATVDKLTASPGMFVTYNKNEFSSRYKGLKVLGKGSFGQVILCMDRMTGLQRAVKVITADNSKKNSAKCVDRKALRTEVDLLKTLDHPNIMKLYEFYEDAKYCYIVTEVYSGGELFDAILERKRYSEIDAAIIIKQVLSGITYMHKHNVVHRDLKPENLLLESKEKNANIKIIDFGLSTYLDALKGKRDKLGTAYYIAPEILLGKECTEKCDVWSTGVILYILLSGCPPFGGADEQAILSRVKTGRFSFSLPQWNQVSQLAKDLICKMLTFSPTSRISAAAALEHEWVKHMTLDHEKLELPSLESSIKNIRQFQGSQKLAKAALLYMGSKLTSLEETKHLTSIFSKIDKNGDGQLDRSELIEGYKELLRLKGQDVTSLNVAEIEEEVDNVLKSIDFDNNGYIEYSEFVTVAMDRETLLSKERLIRAFKDFDVDGSGKISTDELAILFGLGASDIDKDIMNELLKDIDQNNDGEIDFEEFQTMLMKLCGEAVAA